MPAFPALLLTSVLVVGMVAAPARAEGEIGFSWDGSTWTDRLPGTLFDESVRWVPGDVRTSQFFVRNRAEGSATVSVAVRSNHRNRLLRARDISLMARVGAGPWVDLVRRGEDHLLSRRDLGPGERTRVQVRASFDPASANQSQREEFDLRFRVTLTDARSGGGSDAADVGAADEEHTATPGNGVLPGTGAPRLGWLLLLSTALIGSGLTLQRRRHREVAGNG